MQYFLAYEKQNGKLVKIPAVVSNDFYDILSYTLKFVDRMDLIRYLRSEYFIDNKTFNIFYCSQINKKDETTIKKIPNSQLRFKDAKGFFDPTFIRTYIIKNCQNLDFLETLFAHYMRKFGILAVLKTYLEDLFNITDKYLLISRLLTLQDYVIDETGDNIKYLIDNYDLLSKDYYSYQNRIDYIIEQIVSNPNNYINLYPSIREKLLKENKIKNFPIMSCLYRIRAIYYYQKSFKDYEDVVDCSNEIDNLVKLMLFKYGEIKDCNGNFILINGKRKKDFLIKNGTYIVKSRDLYDIGNLLYNYSNRTILKKTVPKEEDFIESHRLEHEEFLTEEDYKFTKGNYEDE